MVRLLLFLCLPLVALACTRAPIGADKGASSQPTANPEPSAILPEKGSPANPGGEPLPPGALARIGSAQLYHGAHVKAIAFSPDSKSIASGSDDRTVRLWDAATGRLLHLMRGHEGAVNAVCFSPDGKLLVSGSGNFDGAGVGIRVWDPESGKELRRFDGHVFRVCALTFSPDGKTLASSGADGYIRLWARSSWQLLRAWQVTLKPVLTLAFSPDGKTLASAGSDCNLRLWETATGKQAALFHEPAGPNLSVSFSPDGKLLASGAKNTIRVYDVSKKMPRYEIETGDQICAVAFSRDSKMLASGGYDEKMSFWDAVTGSRIDTFEKEGLILSIAFSPDGKMLATGDLGGIERWDARTRQRIPRAGRLRGRIRTLAFSPDGATLATGTSGETIRLWRATDGMPTGRIPGCKHTESLSFTPDGRYLIGASLRGSEIWPVGIAGAATGFNAAVGQGQRAAVLPSGKTVLLASFDNLRELRIPDGWEVGRFPSVRYFDPHCLALAPDGKTVVAGGNGENLYYWDVPSRQLTNRHKVLEDGYVRDVRFCPDGSLLATCGGNGVIRLWDPKTRMEHRSLKGHRGIVWALAFSPDGSLLASADDEGMILLWNPKTGDMLHRLSGQNSRIQALVFAPDGKRLASGSDDGTVLLWDMERLGKK